MAKTNTSDENLNRFNADDSMTGTYNQSLDEGNFNESEVVLSDTVSLRFTQNRSFDLHIGRKIYRFKPYEERKDVPISVLNHKDFESVKKYFTIKENK